MFNHDRHAHMQIQHYQATTLCSLSKTEKEVVIRKIPKIYGCLSISSKYTTQVLPINGEPHMKRRVMPMTHGPTDRNQGAM
jgi:hypothetical protein